MTKGNGRRREERQRRGALSGFLILVGLIAIVMFLSKSC